MNRKRVHGSDKLTPPRTPRLSTASTVLLPPWHGQGTRLEATTSVVLSDLQQRKLRQALPATFAELRVVFLNFRLSLLYCRIKQENKRRQRQRSYDVGRRVPELRTNRTARGQGCDDAERDGAGWGGMG